MEGDMYSDYDYEIRFPAPALKGAIPGFFFGQSRGDDAHGSSNVDISTHTGSPLIQEIRPMTSTSGAGFSTKPSEVLSLCGEKFLSARERCALGRFDPLGKEEQRTNLACGEPTPENRARVIERQVHTLFEESVIAFNRNEHGVALEKAKEAGKKERALCKYREVTYLRHLLSSLQQAHGLIDTIQMDLTYAICFNLANRQVYLTFLDHA